MEHQSNAVDCSAKKCVYVCINRKAALPEEARLVIGAVGYLICPAFVAVVNSAFEILPSLSVSILTRSAL